MGPNPEGKLHLVTLAGGLDGAIIGTTDTLNGPPGALAPITSQPVPASTPLTYYAPSVDPQPARADGSIVHVVRSGNTVNTIAQAYRVDPQIIIERNQLAGGGRLIFPGQVLVIRDATPPGGNDADLPTPVYAGDDE